MKTAVVVALLVAAGLYLYFGPGGSGAPSPVGQSAGITGSDPRPPLFV